MPKLKTHSGTKDRVKVTKNGKVQTGHSSTNHFLKKQSAASKRRKAVPGTVVGKMAKSIKQKLGA